MAYQVLARTYRPQTLEDVLGQDHVTTTLRNAISGDRVAHAYLFTGARGVGKTSSARILAKALNCIQGPTITPCNQCENCVEITKGNSIDVFEIDAASNTGVDNVRELQEGLRYMPGKSRFKIYIIDEVHMLSGSAFNALLKTLEEPPAHVRFIFATTEPHKIPVTILSRCQRFDFKRLSRTKIVERLRYILTTEKVTFTEGALQIIAREAEGSMRDALSLTDQALSFGGGALDEPTVASALGVIDRKVLSEAVRAILGGDASSLLGMVDQIYDYGYDVKQFTKNLLEHFRNLLVVRVSNDSARLVDLPPEDIEELKKQSAGEAVDRLHRLFGALLRLSEDVARTSHARMVLEIGLVRVATLGPLQPVEELLGRLRDLSNRPPPIAGGLAGPVQFKRLEPVGTPMPAPAHVSAPPMPREQTPATPVTRDPSPATGDPSASSGGAPLPATMSGAELVDHIKRANQRVGSQLGNAVAHIEGNKVSFRLPADQAFLIPLLKTPLFTDELKSLTGAALGRRVEIDVGVDANRKMPPPPPALLTAAPASGQRQTRASEAPGDKERKREAYEHPAVQEVLRVFGSGRIVDIHLLRSATLGEPQDDESSEQE